MESDIRVSYTAYTLNIIFVTWRLKLNEIYFGTSFNGNSVFIQRLTILHGCKKKLKEHGKRNYLK